MNFFNTIQTRLLFISIGLFLFLGTGQALASATDNVFGWAWNDNIGWISMNSLNCDGDGNNFIDIACGGVDNNSVAVVDYGVKVDADGNFSGYAWSEIHGYIKFNPAGPGWPENPDHGVELDILDKDVNNNQANITGWARICTLADDVANCQNGTAGWIEFEDDAPFGFDTSLDKANYLHGYAFSDAIGYISWNCVEGGDCGISNYKVGVKTDVTGWAWNSDYGWFDFNCANVDVGAGDCSNFYGVNIDPVEKVLGGYAWNPNVGWLSFEESDLPIGVNYSDFNSTCVDSTWCNEASDNCTACVDTSGNLQGWAKILSLGDDGWVSMNRVAPAYAVVYDDVDDEFEGFSWNNGTGWLSWNCETDPTDPANPLCTEEYSVKYSGSYFNTNLAPTPINLSLGTTYPCTESALLARLKWVFDDPDIGDSQTAYRIVFDDDNGDPELESSFDTLKCSAATPVGDCRYANTTQQFNLDSGDLSYGDTVYWWVQVWDGGDEPSALVQGPDVHVSPNKYPDPSVFTWIPSSFSLGETVLLDSQTQARYFNGGVSSPCDDTNCSWTWEAIGGIDIIFDDSNASITTMVINELNVGVEEIRLKVSDGTNECSSTTDFDVKDKLPQWIEAR